MFVHTSLFFSLSQKFRSQRKPLNMLCFVPHHTVNQVGWCWTRKQNSWTKCSFAISSFILAFSENEWSGGWVCWFLAVFVCVCLCVRRWIQAQIRFLFYFPIFFSLFHILWSFRLLHVLFFVVVRMVSQLSFFCLHSTSRECARRKFHIFSINFIWFVMLTHTLLFFKCYSNCNCNA